MCNGEIYGFEKLRKELSGKYSFVSDSDCEILLPMYKEYGTEMFAMLDAEFACIIYDGDLPTINEIKNACEFSKTEQKWIDKLVESYKYFSMNFDVMKLNVTTDELVGNKYNYKEVEFSDFLKSKIEKLNTL